MKRSDWRNAWLMENMESVLTWEDLAERFHPNGTNEQTFWRASQHRPHQMDDRQMLESGLLLDDPSGRKVHIAYVPWNYADGTAGKSAWGDEEWAKFDQAVGESHRVNRSVLRGMKWTKLTISTSSAKQFLEGEVRNSHFVGRNFSDALPSDKLSSNLFEGDINLASPSISHAVILGVVLVTSKPFRATDVKIGRVSFSSHDDLKYDIEINGSHIGEFLVRGSAKSITILGSEIEFFDASNCKLGPFTAVGSNGEAFGLNLGNSVVEGRVNLTNVCILPSVTDAGEIGFEHTKFAEKVLCANSTFDLSLFADSQLEEPIDIRFLNSTPEDVFERELKSISSLEGARYEPARARLEGACQIICDRHRQDGRKDLEHRFRRLEIKARSRRLGADRSTKVLNFIYGSFSDFGRSVWRPLGGLTLVWVFFGFCYWVSASLKLGLPVDTALALDTDVLVDSVLMSTDKLFPFGSSIDEGKLFAGRVIGEEGGVSGVLLGILGATQTVLSGAMVFMVGLAIRTRLLIG